MASAKLAFRSALLLLISVAAVVANPVFEIRNLTEMVDLSRYGEDSFMRRTLLQETNGPRTTYTIAGAKVGVYSFAGFVGTASSLSLYNSAAIVGSRLRLVGGGVNDKGQATLRPQIPFYNLKRGLAGIFGAKFTYLISGPNTRATCLTAPTKCPGQGFTFTFQVGTPQLGGNSFNLGYGGTGVQSVAVEFDIVKDASANDPSNNHIGFDGLGSVQSVKATDLTGTGFDIVNGNRPATVWIEFLPMLMSTAPDGTAIPPALNLVLNVFIADGLNPAKPDVPLFTTTADPAIILKTVNNNKLFVGFTASNGPTGSSIIEILNWGFFSSTFGAFT